jgi:hypothetical protein
MPFDPTPAAGVPGVTRLPLLSRLRQLTDGLEFLYDRYILGFAQGDQIEMIRAVRDAAGTLVESARQAVERLRGAWGAAVGAAGRAAATAIVVAIAAALLLVLFLSRRGVLGRSRPLAPAAATYRKLQRILRRKGARLTAAAAPKETLEAAIRFGPRAGNVAAEIVRAYARESFGGSPLGQREAARLVERLRFFRDSLRSDQS